MHNSSLGRGITQLFCHKFYLFLPPQAWIVFLNWLLYERNFFCFKAPRVLSSSINYLMMVELNLFEESFELSANDDKERSYNSPFFFLNWWLLSKNTYCSYVKKVYIQTLHEFVLESRYVVLARRISNAKVHIWGFLVLSHPAILEQ